MFARMASSVIVGLLALTGVAQAQIAPPVALKPGVYRLDPARTRVVFRVSQLGPMAIRGEFPGAAGTLTVHDQDPVLARLDVRLPVEQVTASSAAATATLKSPAMLDSAAFPTISFRSTRMVATGPATIDVEGDLTLHGVSRPVVLQGRRGPAVDGAPAYRFTTTIKRGEFGVRGYRGLVGDKVRLDIHAVLTPVG